MATLVFTSIGAALGGPLGGALGGLVGRSVDQALFGPSGREGPRLDDLRITTSSYGSAIPQHHGTIRAPGTIIWSTDLIERSEKRGGGKGSPSVKVFSYSASFAVALASRPILGLGRIWADGNLLRGAAGDLKTGGTLRLYTGHGDHPADPLIAAAQGAGAPAFRGMAYAVFEELDLAEFGNRIPALTFEIIADEGDITLAGMLRDLDVPVETDVAMPNLSGFSCEGGPMSLTLATLHTVYPLACDIAGSALKISAADTIPADPPLLPEAARSSRDGDFGPVDGRHRLRQADYRATPSALRYYDVARDYLAGLQRAEGRARPGREQAITFPGALSAAEARNLISAAAERAGWGREALSWRMAALDPTLGPGAVVRVPGQPGYWRITSWEWRDNGVELQLLRLPHGPSRQMPGDAGAAQLPVDLLIGPTFVQAFGLPWDGQGNGDEPRIYAALSSESAGWKGAMLHADQGGVLASLGSGRQRARLGHCTEAVPPSPAVLLERQAAITVQLVPSDLGLNDATPEALAGGANRALVGKELLQFARAEALGQGQWRLEGLLRGRGGTEAAAMAGHPAGTPFTLLDDALVSLDPAITGSAAVAVLATGLGDLAPATAMLDNPQASLKPLVPVHACARFQPDGGLMMAWTRRARGAWAWRDEVDAPLGEQTEAYRVGLGPVAAPLLTWDVTAPTLAFAPATLAQMVADHAGAALWVRQIGNHALSDPLLLATLP